LQMMPVGSEWEIYVESRNLGAKEI